MNVTTNTPDDLLGSTLAGYTLTRVLGTGSVGVVMLGEHPHHLTDQVAIKICIPPIQMQAEERAVFQARFLREAEIVQRLQHPHIVPVLQHGVERGLLYTVFRFMDGGSLAERQIRRAAPLPLAEVCHIVTQLADALDAAHAAGVIHRDVKPTNILFDHPDIFSQHEQFSTYDDVYLSDFSILHLQQDVHTTLTMTGQILGTLEYMAPEQASGEPLTAAADNYSLAVVAYELITGQPPFVGTTPLQILLQLVQTTPTAPRHVRPDLPEAAEAALLQALAKAPADRYPSAGAFAATFAAGLRGEWAAAYQPVVTVTPLFPEALIVAPDAVDDIAVTSRSSRLPARSWWFMAAGSLLLVLTVVSLLLVGRPANKAIATTLSHHSSPSTSRGATQIPTNGATSPDQPTGMPSPIVTTGTNGSGGIVPAPGTTTPPAPTQPPAPGWHTILNQSQPACNNPAGTHWFSPNINNGNGGIEGQCASNGLVMQQTTPAHFAENDITTANGATFSQTLERESVQAQFLTPNDTATWAVLNVDAPASPTAYGGYNLEINSSGAWLLIRTNSFNSFTTLASGNTGSAHATVTLTIVVQNGQFNGYVNGALVTQYPDGLNPQPGSSGLLVRTPSGYSTSVAFTNYTLDSWH